MALHEMWEVSALPLGSFLYEEYFPCEAELALLEKQEPALLESIDRFLLGVNHIELFYLDLGLLF